jgi:hypothetical protein
MPGDDRCQQRAVEACATLTPVTPIPSSSRASSPHATPGLETHDIIRTARVAPAELDRIETGHASRDAILLRAASALDELTLAGANARLRSWLQ